MSWLLDTNVLLRLADEQSREHSVAEEAIARLLERGIPAFISAQVLVEFWAVATRPEQVNGLGWSTATTAETIRALRDRFPMLDETPDVWDRWFELVERCQVAGKRTHDARLAALLVERGIRRLLTFNTADFPASWGVDAFDPVELLATDGHSAA
jgi:predicted nucleic acid-binding protein